MPKNALNKNNNIFSQKPLIFPDRSSTLIQKHCFGAAVAIKRNMETVGVTRSGEG